MLTLPTHNSYKIVIVASSSANKTIKRVTHFVLLYYKMYGYYIFEICYVQNGFYF